MGELSISVEYITLELCTSIEYIALELCTSVEYETLELSTHAKSVEYIYRVHYKSLVHSFEEFEYISTEHYISTERELSKNIYVYTIQQQQQDILFQFVNIQQSFKNVNIFIFLFSG